MERAWIIEADEYGRIPADELAQAGADAAAVVARLGGVASIACHRRYREELPGTSVEMFDTLAVIFSYNSFAPGERPPKSPEAAAAEVLPEPEQPPTDDPVEEPDEAAGEPEPVEAG